MLYLFYVLCAITIFTALKSLLLDGKKRKLQRQFNSMIRQHQMACEHYKSVPDEHKEMYAMFVKKIEPVIRQTLDGMKANGYEVPEWKSFDQYHDKGSE